MELFLEIGGLSPPSFGDVMLRNYSLSKAEIKWMRTLICRRANRQIAYYKHFEITRSQAMRRSWVIVNLYGIDGLESDLQWLERHLALDRVWLENHLRNYHKNSVMSEANFLRLCALGASTKKFSDEMRTFCFLHDIRIV